MSSLCYDSQPFAELRRRAAPGWSLFLAYKTQTHSQNPSQWENPQQNVASLHTRTWPPHPAPSSSSYIHILEMVLAFDSPNFKGFVRAPFPVQSSLLLLQKMSLRSRWNHSKPQMCRAQHGPGPAAEAGCKFQTLGFVENVIPLNSWLGSI